NAKTALSDLGIPLRLKADIAEKVGRGTVQEVYDQIINDLNQAITLLPSVTQPYRTTPTKQAAYATLARVYLTMGDYGNALSNANSALGFNNTLLDYNTLTPSSRLSMPYFYNNPEVLIYSVISTGILANLYAVIDSSLYKSYDNNDLRKTLFFSGIPNAYGPSFVGTYGGKNPYQLFSAPAVDELYLIKAECEARAGSTNQAMTDLNALLSKRWKTGTFTNRTASSSSDALAQILTERRKELVMRGVRWSDLRRLNGDPNYSVTITRKYKGQLYNLTPGSNLYVWPIPQDEILYSGIPDNPR
ncbi:MAG: RagB/SusD family nutrient uptake outer membrane protein, partial [Bacteroidetes bacterium]|nr:RagB/SusD family nutrient uptake outer membrane protein [Bacteroidota bacterium]